MITVRIETGCSPLVCWNCYWALTLGIARKSSWRITSGVRYKHSSSLVYFRFNFVFCMGSFEKWDWSGWGGSYRNCKGYVVLFIADNFRLPCPHSAILNTDAGSKLSLAVEQIKLSIFNTSEAAVKTVSNRFYRLTYGSNGLYGANLRSDSIVKNYLKPPNNVSMK